MSESPGLLERARQLGPASQALVPGLYAWITTVAPLAWTRGASWLGSVASMVGLAGLVGAALLEHQQSRVAPVTTKPGEAGASTAVVSPLLRLAPAPLCVWSFTLSSALVFALATPRALRMFDVSRGAASVAGWMLFAFTACAPALARRGKDEDRITRDARLMAQRAPLDNVLLFGSFAAALVLQGWGWGAEQNERGVLIRLVAAVLSIGLIGVATAVIAGRQRDPKAGFFRLGGASLPWVLLALMLLTYVVFFR
jgi:hypothetical protein